MALRSEARARQRRQGMGVMTTFVDATTTYIQAGMVRSIVTIHNSAHNRYLAVADPQQYRAWH